MKSLKLLILFSALLSAGAVQAASAAGGHDSCLSVHATAIGQNLGGGRTTSTVVHAGILNGTAEGRLHVIGAHPPFVTVVGQGVLTTDIGTLTLAVTGTFNQATGAFEFTGEVVAGTGHLAHATGTLTFAGVEDLTSGSFSDTITGTVCLAH